MKIRLEKKDQKEKKPKVSEKKTQEIRRKIRGIRESEARANQGESKKCPIDFGFFFNKKQN